MKSIEKVYSIEASIKEVWDALINPEKIERWSGSAAEMSDKEGSKFKLWDGEMYGTNTKIEKGGGTWKLEQDWYAYDWKVPSKVVFTLKELKGTTELHLLHSNVPDKEAKDIDFGWDDYYLGPLKELAEGSK